MCANTRKAKIRDKSWWRTAAVHLGSGWDYKRLSLITRARDSANIGRRWKIAVTWEPRVTRPIAKAVGKVVLPKFRPSDVGKNPRRGLMWLELLPIIRLNLGIMGVILRGRERSFENFALES